MNAFKNKRILYTRPEINDPFYQQLKLQGATLIHLPIFSIEQALPSSTLEEKLKQSFDCDLMIFMSKNCLQFHGNLIKSYYNHLPIPPTLIAIGETTANALIQLGLPTPVQPLHASSEGLMLLPLLQHLDNKTILLFKGKGGRPDLIHFLQGQKATIHIFSVYKRVIKNYTLSQLKTTLTPSPDILITTSVEMLEGLNQLLQNAALTNYHQLPLYVLGKRQALAAEKLGFEQIVVLSTL
jgi:uroporphyrinogen-III synthase